MAHKEFTSSMRHVFFYNLNIALPALLCIVYEYIDSVYVYIGPLGRSIDSISR